ncbi:No apical meristem (NAM) [Heracleum sosnowskyi]|uniref:No apical meristem (NAM) n=1 Tax=Heracleum sosnowskyi TaxID=360622 RepID=A0AAD8I5M6_9APIA|nr:No apical meristem (NAM) [Heracleum sosnowskyi]
MDQERSHDDSDKLDEVMLPGFRFHPTDEELVGFYLKRKIQQRPLSIELIKQLDIYKFDPWDLPTEMASTGEKEWYFYCPRDRKYRNSARPNRVTGAGFWKATGTDRPIYSSEGTSKCIGLKKSLVFYKGRAAKGIKTDWMMHEFRLPSLGVSVPPKRYIDKNSIPANDAWAICRIFKKANSNAQRALSNSWVSPDLPVANNTTLTSQNLTPHYHTSTNGNTTPTCNNDLRHSSITNPTPNYFDLPIHKAYNQMASGYTFFGQETADYQLTKCNTDTSSLLFNMSSSVFGDFEKVSGCLDYKGIQDQYANTCFPISSIPQVEEHIGHEGENFMALLKESCPNVMPFDDQLGVNIRSSLGLPYILPLSMSETWRSSFLCDSSPCPSDQMSASYSTNKCNT